MTNKDILTKAIGKSVKNGWTVKGLLEPMDPGSYKVKAPFNGDYIVVELTFWGGDKKIVDIEEIIYNKDFAKALWGEDYIANRHTFSPHAWQYHLQQMVIADDPIKYLGENI